MIKQKVKWVNIIISSVIYLIVLFMLFIFYIKKTTLYDIFNYINIELTENLYKFLQNERAKGLSGTEFENLKWFFELFVIKMIYAYMFLFVLALVFLNYLVVRLFVISKYKIISEIPQFKIWYLDEKLIWVLIVAIIFMLSKKFLNNETIYIIAINIIFILANLYFLIGLSIVFFLMEKHKLPVYIQIFLIFIIILWSHLSFIVMLTGIMDTWFDFRKIKKEAI